MKILHLPTDTGGNAWGLSRGEQELGLESKVLTLTHSSIGYPSDICLDLNALPKIKGLKFLKLLWTFLKIRSQYNIFHFNYGSSLLHRREHPSLYQWELPFYPKNAKLFVTYNGCDARQKFPTMARTPTAACHQQECYGGICNSGKRDMERQLSIRKMARYVSHIWALNPDLLHFLPPEKASFLPYAVAYKAGKYCRLPQQRKLKIAHAPTNQAAKGSKFILSALDKLRKKYPNDIDIELIQNMSYSKALCQYQQADLVIDQILIGWYGAFAVETMMMGKPVIARIASEDLTFLPPKMGNELMSTIIQADPLTIYDVVEKCIHDRKFLVERSQASYDYSTRWHDPKYVASLTKEKYESAL